MPVFFAALLLLLSGCAVAPPRHPTSVRHGVLVAQARVRGAILGFTSDLPDRGVIEQLDADGVPVPGKVAEAGFHRDGRLYFVDLPPGRYALSKLSFPARGVRYEIELSSAAMRREVAELGPGKAAFLGDLVLDGRFPEFDVAVERALDVLGHWLTPFLRRPIVPRDADVRTFLRTPDAERKVLLAARADLDVSPWRALTDDRLREMGAAEPAPLTGGLRKKEIPLQPEAFFSWRDTLKWGEPAKGRTGLAWKRDGGEAKIAVFFTTATTPGFVGYEEAVRQMRAAAGGLEDSAALYEVRVGTRTGIASRLTANSYPDGTLIGSERKVVVTETVLVEDPLGMFTARLRAPRDEFDRVLPAFREFLLQLSLGPPAKAEPEKEPILPP